MNLLIGGGWYIMIPLGILSIIAVYIFIERYLSVSRVVKGDTSFMASVREAVLKGEIESARRVCKDVNNPYSRMIEKGVNRINKPMTDISAAIENQGKLEVFKMELPRFLSFVIWRLLIKIQFVVFNS